MANWWLIASKRKLGNSSLLIVSWVARNNQPPAVADNSRHGPWSKCWRQERILMHRASRLSTLVENSVNDPVLIRSRGLRASCGDIFIERVIRDKI